MKSSIVKNILMAFVIAGAALHATSKVIEGKKELAAQRADAETLKKIAPRIAFNILECK